METERQRRIRELARRESWRRTAPALAEALTPLVIAPEDTEWAGSVSLEESDRLKHRYYEILGSPAEAEDGPSDRVAILWGDRRAQFDRLRRLVGEIGGDIALSVISDGVVRTRSTLAAKRLKRLFEHFGTLDVLGIDAPGGASMYVDPREDEWFELTVVGEEWVQALRRVV